MACFSFFLYLSFKSILYILRLLFISTLFHTLGNILIVAVEAASDSAVHWQKTGRADDLEWGRLLGT